MTRLDGDTRTAVPSHGHLGSASMADRERNGYTLSTDPGRVDVETVHRWLSQDAYWALGRPREVVETTVCTCDVWSVFAPDGAQVAFTRAVTDGLTFAWICDVYVHR